MNRASLRGFPDRPRVDTSHQHSASASLMDNSKVNLSRLSKERTSDSRGSRNIARHPSVGDQIGIITINNFFHIGTLEAFDEKNDAIYLKNVTGELLEGNIPLYDGKVFGLVKFQKEQVVGVILYEENPISTSASANTERLASSTLKTTVAESMARDNSNPQTVATSMPNVSHAQIHPNSNVSLSPLVPRRPEMPPRLRQTFGSFSQTVQTSPRLRPTFVSLSQTVQASVQNAKSSKESVQIAATQPPGAQNASSPNELFVVTTSQAQPQPQLPGFTAVRAHRWEHSLLPNVTQSFERRPRLPQIAMKSKKDEIRRKWQEKQAAQSDAARASEDPSQQLNAYVQTEARPNSREGGDTQLDSTLSSENEAVSAEAVIQVPPPQAFFDQQLTSAISDQFAGVRPCLSANRLQSVGVEAFGSDCNELITRTKSRQLEPLDATQSAGATIYPPLGASHLVASHGHLQTPALLPTPPARSGAAGEGFGKQRYGGPANFVQQNHQFRSLSQSHPFVPPPPQFVPPPPQFGPPPFGPPSFGPGVHNPWKGFPDVPAAPSQGPMRLPFCPCGQPLAPNKSLQEQQLLRPPVQIAQNRMLPPLAAGPDSAAMQNFRPNAFANPRVPFTPVIQNVRPKPQHVPPKELFYSSHMATRAFPHLEPLLLDCGGRSMLFPSPSPVPPPHPPTPSSMVSSLTPSIARESVLPSSLHRLEQHCDDTLKPYGYSLLPRSFISTPSSEAHSEGAQSAPGTPPPTEARISKTYLYKAEWPNECHSKAAVCNEFKRKVLESLAASGAKPVDKQLLKNEAPQQAVIGPDLVSSTESVQMIFHATSQEKSFGGSSGEQKPKKSESRDRLGSCPSSTELATLHPLKQSSWNSISSAEKVGGQQSPSGIASSAGGETHRLGPLVEELRATAMKSCSSGTPEDRVKALDRFD